MSGVMSGVMSAQSEEIRQSEEMNQEIHPTADPESGSDEGDEREYPSPGCRAACDGCGADTRRFYHCLQCGVGASAFDVCVRCHRKGFYPAEHTRCHPLHELRLVTPKTAPLPSVKKPLTARARGSVLATVAAVPLVAKADSPPLTPPCPPLRPPYASHSPLPFHPPTTPLPPPTPT